MEAIIYEHLKNKDTNAIIEELRKDPSLISFVDSRGTSLLMLSFYFKNQELSDYILSHRKPLDIYESVISNDLKAAKKFLSADRQLLDKHSKDGFTPLGFAAFFSRAQIAEFLVKEGADVNVASNNDFKVAPIHSAVAAKNPFIVQLLINHVANPNAQQQNDVTPLHAAAHNNSLEIVQILLKSGADKDLKTKDGKSARDFAEEIDAKQIAELL
jgi:uncharacterized protein